jgi:Cu(I)/Ag(I) efflux system protein CusF
MNTITKFLTISAIALGAAVPISGYAQANIDHSKTDMLQMTPSMTDGEVKKVDAEAGKITIKHGPIKHLDMPGMSMVFTAKDKSLLANLKPSDKIQFMVRNEEGKMVITAILVMP